MKYSYSIIPCDEKALYVCDVCKTKVLDNKPAQLIISDRKDVVTKKIKGHSACLVQVLSEKIGD